MISESRCSWCAVSVIGIPLYSWASVGGINWEIATTWKLWQRTKNLQKTWRQQLNWLVACNDSFVFDMTLTLRKSWVHCCGVMRFWACSSLMSATLPAEAGCETWVRVVIKWPSLRNCNMATKVHLSCGSRSLAACDCWRHLWQVMQRDNDCWLQ